MADSTLDEIIKQKRLNRFGGGNQKKGGNQNAAQQKGPKKAAPRVQAKTLRGRLYKEVQKDLGIKVQKPAVSIKTDARNKIIQSKRFQFKDARDRLAQIAKQGDARDKLNLIRKANPGQKKVPGVPQLKKTLVKKKNTNVPKQALRTGQPQVRGNVLMRTGQTQMKGNALVRTVAGADYNRKKKAAIPQGNAGVVKKTAYVTKAQRAAGRSLPIANNPSVITIKNDNAQLYDTYEDVTDYRQEVHLGSRGQSYGGMGMPSGMNPMMTMRPQQVMRSRPVEHIYLTDYDQELRPSRLRITAADSEYRISGQQYVEDFPQPQAWQPQSRMQPSRMQPSRMQPSRMQPSRVQPRKRELYDEQVEYQAYPKKVTQVAAPQPQGERGTKVIVSNLHPCVSVEDMEELFGTIGAIHSVRMVRQGVAEALFVSQEDAYRSVDLFNNRQLDGQPMKVMVVRKKTPLMTTPPVQARSVLKSARGRTGYYV